VHGGEDRPGGSGEDPSQQARGDHENPPGTVGSREGLEAGSQHVEEAGDRLEDAARNAAEAASRGI
jgi:hypothetical protein